MVDPLRDTIESLLRNNCRGFCRMRGHGSKIYPRCQVVKYLCFCILVFVKKSCEKQFGLALRMMGEMLDFYFSPDIM